MITTVCLNSHSRVFSDNCVAADISELREAGDNVIWADVADPTSRDFEDMVFIFENCKDFDSQIRNGPASVREYFAEEFKVVLDHPDFEEALYAHMEPAPHGANVGKLIEKIRHSIDVLS